MNIENTNLTDKKINELFDNYSYPMVKACITELQKEKAIALSKILWLLLITGTDTEENIYITLKEILHQHDKIVSVGALYTHKMKKALTKKEMQMLKKHYENSENFNSLKEWGDMTFLKNSYTLYA